MNCPNCGAAMRERDRSGVKVDFCPDCKGIWLDRGELDKIIAIELSGDDEFEGHAIEARNAENARQARRGDDDDDDRRYGDRSDGERGRKSKKGTFFESLTEMFGGE